ncbi:MAG: DMT family transporter [Bacteroidaceae bacterium]|nr:DMT family transporter [Bacteroidaceae bacterium]
MNKTIIGHLASLTTYSIFGLNIVFCKDIANSDILSPYALFMFRAVGATLLFWLISLFMPKEHIPRKDKRKIVLASFIGLFMPQMTFLIAITMTSSIDTSVLGSLTPIMTMFMAAYFLKEPITWKKATGVTLSFVGVLILIFNSMYHKGGGATQTTPLGIILLFLNCLSFAIYLGAFRPLISKYSVVTFMKWMFLFTLIICTPFCASDAYSFIMTATTSPAAKELADSGYQLIWEIGYVVVFATFIAYFLVPVGQKHLRPTLVSMYSYVQPIIAVIISAYIGMDTLTWKKIIAIILVFTGVAIVNKSRAAASKTTTDSKL